MPRRTSNATTLRLLALSIAGLIVIGCSTTGPTVTFGTEPTGQSSQPAASTGALTEAPASEPVPTDAAPTEAAPTEAPPIEEPTDEATLEPGATPTPNVTSIKVPTRPDCNTDNGTGTVGYIHVSWAAEGTEGVRLSIDPPSAAEAYGYGFADYPATGGADVPFTCGAPNHDANGDYHLYVVTTVHAKGYFAWRFAKVYQKAP